MTIIQNGKRSRAHTVVSVLFVSPDAKNSETEKVPLATITSFPSPSDRFFFAQGLGIPTHPRSCTACCRLKQYLARPSLAVFTSSVELFSVSQQLLLPSAVAECKSSTRAMSTFRFPRREKFETEKKSISRTHHFFSLAQRSRW